MTRPTRRPAAPTVRRHQNRATMLMPAAWNTTHRALMEWVGAWPIYWKSPPRYARIELRPLAALKKLHVFWRDSDSTSVTVQSAHRRISRHNWLGKQHQIESLARHGAPDRRPVIVVQHGRVMDGNHTLMALRTMRYTGSVLVITLR